MPAISHPSNANNAIETALFVVVLSQPINPIGWERVREALNTLATELPGTSQPMAPGIVFNFGAGGGMPAPHMMELARFRSAPNGTHEWRVQISGNVVQVVCQKFNGFAEVWNTAGRHLRLLLGALDPQMPVHEIGFQVLNKFVYEDGINADNYDMTELFRTDSPYLTPKSLNCGLMWHLHQGWFENQSDNTNVLQQLNLANDEAGGGQFVTIIDHRAILRTNAQDTLAVQALLGDSHGTPERLNDIYQTLHQCNLRMLRELLTDEKLRVIGMQVAP